VPYGNISIILGWREYINERGGLIDHE